MSILDKYLPFVKEQYSFHDRMASKFASEPNRYVSIKKHLIHSRGWKQIF